MPVASRPYTGLADLRAMQELALELRRLEGPRAPWHVGDIAWGLRLRIVDEGEWKIRLWGERGRVVAWSWLRRDSGALDADVHPRHRGGPLHDELLAEPDATSAWAMDGDEATLEALVRNGFTKPGRVLDVHRRDLADAPEPPPLPDGFRYRTVDPADVAERVAIHRDVWAPSRVTEMSYENVRVTWPYRSSLDCVVEAPDGRFAAYCLVWPDDENAVGELEPVGTREPFRRRGLGTAVCTFALRRLWEEGGREAIVYSDTDPAYALYSSLGFHRHAGVVEHAR